MPTRGQRLIRAIKSRHGGKMLTLAADLGVDESAISRWKKNGPMSLEHAARLCHLLDISLDWLVLGRGDPDIHKRAALSDRQIAILAATGRLPTMHGSI